MWNLCKSEQQERWKTNFPAGVQCKIELKTVLWLDRPKVVSVCVVGLLSMPTKGNMLEKGSQLNLERFNEKNLHPGFRPNDKKIVFEVQIGVHSKNLQTWSSKGKVRLICECAFSVCAFCWSAPFLCTIVQICQQKRKTNRKLKSLCCSWSAQELVYNCSELREWNAFQGGVCSPQTKIAQSQNFAKRTHTHTHTHIYIYIRAEQQNRTKLLSYQLWTDRLQSLHVAVESGVPSTSP